MRIKQLFDQTEELKLELDNLVQRRKKDKIWPSEDELKKGLKRKGFVPGEDEVWSNNELKPIWKKILSLYIIDESVVLYHIEQEIEKELSEKLENERYFIIKSYLVWREKISNLDIEKNKDLTEEEIDQKDDAELAHFNIFYSELNKELIVVKNKNKNIFIKRFLTYYKRVLFEVNEINASSLLYKTKFLYNVKLYYNKIILEGNDLRIFETSVIFFFIIVLFLFHIVHIDKILFPVFFLFIIYFYRILITKSLYNIFYFFCFTIIYFEFGFVFLYISIFFMYIVFLYFDKFIRKVIAKLFFIRKKTPRGILSRKDWKSILFLHIPRFRRKIYRFLFFIFYFIGIFILNVLLLQFLIGF
jgi:hypothetical protein